jgi:hypothetical protein
VISSKPGVVRLHAVGRDGSRRSFDALGPKLGEQIQQVLGAWLTARGLGALPRRFEPVTSDDVLAVLRVIAPTLAEQARAWSLPVASKPTWSLAIVERRRADEGEATTGARRPLDDDCRSRVRARDRVDDRLDARRRPCGGAAVGPSASDARSAR